MPFAPRTAPDTLRRALLARKSAEDKGEYLGKELDQKRCEKIRKTAGLGAMSDRDKE